MIGIAAKALLVLIVAWAWAGSVATDPSLFRRPPTSNIDLASGLRCANGLNAAARTGIDSADARSWIPAYVHGYGVMPTKNGRGTLVPGTYIFQKDGIRFCQKSFQDTVQTLNPKWDKMCQQDALVPTAKAYLENFLIYKMKKLSEAVQALNASGQTERTRIAQSNALILKAFAGPGKDSDGKDLDGIIIAGRDWAKRDAHRPRISVDSLVPALMECERVMDTDQKKNAYVSGYAASRRKLWPAQSISSIPPRTPASGAAIRH